MRFAVFPYIWAGSSKMSVTDILKKYCSNKYEEVLNDNPRGANHLYIEVSAEEFMNMSMSKEFDIMISGNHEPRLLAFDCVGKRFTQR